MQPTNNSNSTSAVDPQFLKTIVDIREYFTPMTLRRLLFLLFYGVIIGGLFSLEFTVGLSEYLIPLVRSNFIPVMIILYGFEPALVLASLLFTRYPKPVAPVIAAADVENKEEEAIYEANKDMAIIIPAHNSADFISATIRACLKIVQPKQIFVIDNGNSLVPADNALEVIKRISEDVHYQWHPRGNKTVAQCVGALLAKEYKWTLMIDDDVHPPAHFRLDTTLLDTKNSGVFYPIRAISPTDKTSWLIRCQDLEYQQSDHFKMFESDFHGVLYPHGAVSLWERKCLLKVLSQHDTRFIAEDVQLGLIAEELGYHKKFDPNYLFPTEVPPTLLGRRPNLYNQRARGWSFGIQTMNWQMIRAFITQWNCKPSDVTVLKLSQTYGLYNNAVEWMRLGVMIISASDPLYWARLAAIIGGQQALTLVWHYVKLRNRPDLKQDFATVTTMFFYRWLQIGLTNIGLIRLLMVYLPDLQPTPTIRQLELAGEFTPFISEDNPLTIEQTATPQSEFSFKNTICSFFRRTKAPQPPVANSLVVAENGLAI